MEIITRELDNVIILDIRGELRSADVNMPTLHQLVKERLEENKRNFLVNFEMVKFIDSLGIGELVASFKSAQDWGGKLKIMKLPAKIDLIFKITGLSLVFEIFDAEDEAIRSFF